MSLLSRLLNVFRADRIDRELDEELDTHLAEATARGRDPVEARRNLGSALRLREESRDIRLAQWLESLFSDARFGLRQLWKTRITSAAAILSLGLAIGACTTAFRLIDAILFRPMPVSDPDRLHVVVFSNTPRNGAPGEYDSCSYPMFLRMREAVREPAQLVAVSYADRSDITYRSDDEMEKVHQQYVSGAMFPLFGVHPAAGRLLTDADDLPVGAHPYAVISYEYWSRRFGRDPQAVGRRFRLGQNLIEIIGVADERFTGTETGTATDVFVSMAMKNPETLASSDNFWLRTFVKLRPGAKPAPVEERLRSTFRQIQVERAARFTSMRKDELERFFNEKMSLQPAASGRSNMQRDYSRALVVLAVLVALVLLIACANVGNLMTARAAARSREMALRVSIGAGRLRLVQLVLMEGAWLAAMATGIGALIAAWSAPFLVGMINPPDDPARLSLPLDWRVTLFGIAVAVGVTLLFGLGPALRASAVRPASALKGGEGPSSRRRIMHGLIGAQVAFCFLVLLVAGLFVGTFRQLSNRDLGYSPERIVNLETVVRTPQPVSAWNDVAAHLRAQPGVEKVSLTLWTVMSGEMNVDNISVNGAPPGAVFSDVMYISPGWLETMKVPLLDGVDFREGDTNAGAAIVTREFAKQYFDGQNPVGKWFERDRRGTRTRFHVVGYIGDAKGREVRRPIAPTMFLPFQQLDAAGSPLPRGRATFVVRTVQSNPMALAATLRTAVSQAREGFRVSRVISQTEIVQSGMVRDRLLAVLASFFAVVAWVLAGVGLFGVLDYAVLQRRRELGIRIAVGAPRWNIAGLVAMEAATAMLGGGIAGLGMGLAGARYVESMLFGVRATDPGVLLLPALGLAMVALAASLRPVLRAVRTDPVAMLRLE